MTARNERRTASPQRVAVVERDLAVLEHRVGELEERHKGVPDRVTRLEGHFETMSGQLVALGDGQDKLTVKVSDLAGKVTKILIVMGILATLAQAIVPLALKYWFAAVFP